MKILFISHQATRTGAPLILLELIKWINHHTKNSVVDVLLLEDGELKNNFEKVCSNLFLIKPKAPEKFMEILGNRIKKRLHIAADSLEEKLLRKLEENDYEIIYANSVASLPIGVRIKKRFPNLKLIAHIHELNTIIKISVPEIGNLIGYVDHFIAASKLVKENLDLNYNIPSHSIQVIYEFGINGSASLGNSEAEFIIGASGYAHWRKGYDIFLQVAAQFRKKIKDDNVKFEWVGSTKDHAEIIEADIEKLEIGDFVKFVGEVENPGSYFKKFDVFLLPSREDPFPLVCIEVASMGKPIICFQKASGTTEILQKGGGFVVPYLDVNEMTEKLIYYFRNPEVKLAHGKKAKELFLDFTRDKKCNEIYDVIKAF